MLLNTAKFQGYSFFSTKTSIIRYGVSDSEISIIDQTDNLDDHERKGSFWQYELDITPSSQMDLTGVMWHTFDVIINLTFRQSSFSVVWPTVSLVANKFLPLIYTS